MSRRAESPWLSLPPKCKDQAPVPEMTKWALLDSRQRLLRASRPDLLRRLYRLWWVASAFISIYSARSPNVLPLLEGHGHLGEVEKSHFQWTNFWGQIIRKDAIQ